MGSYSPSLIYSLSLLFILFPFLYYACNFSLSLCSTLAHLHCKEDPIYVFPEMKLRGLIPNFHIHVSVSDIPTDRSTNFAAAN